MLTCSNFKKKKKKKRSGSYILQRFYLKTDHEINNPMEMVSLHRGRIPTQQTPAYRVSETPVDGLQRTGSGLNAWRRLVR